MLELRDYQLSAVERIRNEIRNGNKRPLLVSPTGSGKTCIAAHIVHSAVIKRSKVVFIAHRKEIIQQTSQKLSMLDIEHSIIMSGYRPSMMHDVHVASIQTLIRRQLPAADLIIVDEAHHISSDSYQRVIKEYPNAVVLGLTATPCRSDGKGLAGTFNSIIQVAQTSELIAQGYLVPTIAYAPSRPDLGGVHVRRGDYDAAELETAVDKPKLVGDIVSHWFQFAALRQTIIFATSIAHSQHITEAFRAAGIACEHIDGETPKQLREEILARLASGETRVISNVGVLTEGFDCPIVSCIVLARPTKSLGLYLQMAGRGLRPVEGKTDMLLLDHSGAIYEHGLVEEDIFWTLETNNNVAYKKKEREKRELQPWVCGHCFKVNEPSKNKHCSECGLAPTTQAKSPLIGEGYLNRVKVAKRKPRPEDKQRFWLECLYKASNLGLKVGAAAHMYKDKVGTWPHHSLDKVPRGDKWKMRAYDFLHQS